MVKFDGGKLIDVIRKPLKTIQRFSYLSQQIGESKSDRAEEIDEIIWRADSRIANIKWEMIVAKKCFFVLNQVIAIGFFILLKIDFHAQSFAYHHPESEFLDTCVFTALQNSKRITSFYAFENHSYSDTLSNYLSDKNIVVFDRNEDSLRLTIIRDHKRVDYLKIYYLTDTLKFVMPYSQMLFQTKKGKENIRVMDRTIYTLSSAGSFVNYLDYDLVRFRNLSILNWNKKNIAFTKVGNVRHKKYTYRESLRYNDLKMIECYLIGLNIKEYFVQRIDVEGAFEDDLRTVYYLSRANDLIYKIRIWNHGAISILKFDY
jgi:hypothetical protein